MGLSKKGLLRKVKKLELQGLEKHKITLTHVPDLEKLLNDFYAVRRPKRVDYHHRRDLVYIFNVIAKELYGNSDDSPVVEGFGSFLMDIFTAGSDLDLSVNFINHEVEFPRAKKIRTLRKFAKKFYSLQRGGHVAGIQIITSARVPIVKVIDQGTGIECDLSVENRDGILKSQIFRIISAIDGRFQKLSFLMKAWAKANGINSSRDQTLNSLSIISIVAFHLQTRSPPILPPFSALFKDGTDPATVNKIVKNYMNYGKANKESLPELFVTLFVKLASVEKLWHKGLCISLYEGAWIFKTWNSRLGSISLEDFIDQSQNIARAVGKKGTKKIYDKVHRSLHYLLAFLDGLVQGPKLKSLLFGMDAVSQGDKGNKNLDQSTVSTVHQSSDQAKKMRLTGWEEAQVAKVGEETHIAKGWGGTQVANGWEGTKVTQTWGKTEAANGWGATQVASGWGATQVTQGWGKTQVAKGWGGTQVANGWGGTKLTQGWSGTMLENAWEETQQSKDKQKRKLMEGWGAKQHTELWGGLQTAEGSRGEQINKGWAGSEPVRDREGIHLVNGWGSKQQADAWGEKRPADGWGEKHKVDNWGRKQLPNSWQVKRFKSW